MEVFSRALGLLVYSRMIELAEVCSLHIDLKLGWTKYRRDLLRVETRLNGVHGCGWVNYAMKLIRAIIFFERRIAVIIVRSFDVELT